jgi:hypothetical protein
MLDYTDKCGHQPQILLSIGPETQVLIKKSKVVPVLN